MTFPGAISASMPPDDRLRIGVVTSTDPLIVDVQGALIQPGHLGTYAPAIGEPVALLRQDQSWLALGNTTGSTGPGIGTGVIFARTTPMNIPSGGGGTPATFTDALYDPLGVGFTGSTFTLPAGWAGVWDLNLYGAFGVNATTAGFRVMSIVANGAAVAEWRDAANPTASNYTANSVSITLPLVAGSVISNNIFQNSGVTLTVGGTGAFQFVMSAFLRARTAS